MITNAMVLGLARKLGQRVESMDNLTALLAVVEGLRQKGHVIVLKWDGERNSASGDNGPFTAIISGGSLAGKFFRRDDESLEAALEYVLAAFADSAGSL